MSRPKGFKMSDSHKSAISQALKGRIITPEWRDNLSVGQKIFYSKNKSSNIGIKRSDETKKKISLVQTGKKLSDEHKKNISESCSGSKHYGWNGGVSSFTNRVRSLFEYKEWRKAVFLRDNYTCVTCFKTKCYIEADHINQLGVIIKEFLSFYSQFSIIDDKEILIRLCVSWPDFWDENNGRTLCKECHKLTSTYCKRVK